MDVWEARPSPPEETDGEDHATNHHRRESFFRGDLALETDHFRGVDFFVVDPDVHPTEEDADHDREERETGGAFTPSALFGEGDGKRFEEEVKYAVNEAHVPRSGKGD